MEERLNEIQWIGTGRSALPIDFTDRPSQGQMYYPDLNLTTGGYKQEKRTRQPFHGWQVRFPVDKIGNLLPISFLRGGTKENSRWISLFGTPSSQPKLTAARE
jgi:hypothetical protein